MPVFNSETGQVLSNDEVEILADSIIKDEILSSNKAGSISDKSIAPNPSLDSEAVNEFISKVTKSVRY